jgi:hypothetical protein
MDLRHRGRHDLCVGRYHLRRADQILHESNPFPSLADVFYLATYLLLSPGLIMMVRARRRRDGETGALLDALIITSGLGVLSWIYLIQPYVHAAHMTLLTKFTSIAYPLGDILLLCVLAPPGVRRRD